MLNHKHWHYDRHWQWQPIKARKTEVLKFIHDKEIVTAHDLISQFRYTYNSARCRLSQLNKEGYIEPCLRGQWCLSNRGYHKIHYIRALEEKEEGEKREREREVASLRRRVEELESRLSLVHKSLVRLSEEIQPIMIPAALLARQDPKSGLEYYRLMFARLLVELNGLIKQSAAR